jgi:hypothetical protein
MFWLDWLLQALLPSCRLTVNRAKVLRPATRRSSPETSAVNVSPNGAQFSPDLFVRAPIFRESVFRGSVTRDGILVSDIIQIWLDVTSPPARDVELADEIRQRALAQIFEE